MHNVEHLLILTSTITGCASISAFASVVDIPAIVLKFFAKMAGIKKYKSIIKKNRKIHDKIVFLPKPKLNKIEVLTSKPLTNSNISHHELISINNVLKEYDEIKEKIRSSSKK